jgi:hypothetical protein
MKQLLLVIGFILASLHTHALPIPARWTIDVSKADQPPAMLVSFQGESIDLQAQLNSVGVPMAFPTNSIVTFNWATNSTGPFWSATASLGPSVGTVRYTWSPANDMGAAAYVFYFGITDPSGTIYRAYGRLMMRPSPGFNPVWLPLPTTLGATLTAQIAGLGTHAVGQTNVNNAVASGMSALTTSVQTAQSTANAAASTTATHTVQIAGLTSHAIGQTNVNNAVASGMSALTTSVQTAQATATAAASTTATHTVQIAIIGPLATNALTTAQAGCATGATALAAAQAANSTGATHTAQIANHAGLTLATGAHGGLPTPAAIGAVSNTPAGIAAAGGRTNISSMQQVANVSDHITEATNVPSLRIGLGGRLSVGGDDTHAGGVIFYAPGFSDWEVKHGRAGLMADGLFFHYGGSGWKIPIPSSARVFASTADIGTALSTVSNSFVAAAHSNTTLAGGAHGGLPTPAAIGAVSNTPAGIAAAGGVTPTAATNIASAVVAAYAAPSFPVYDYGTRSNVVFVLSNNVLYLYGQ